MYTFYQAMMDGLAPWKRYAEGAGRMLRLQDLSRPEAAGLRHMAAALDWVAHAGTTASRPDYALGPIRVGDRMLQPTEEVVHAAPFGNLLRFRKDVADPGPKVLVLAPMSGHFATLLRATVRTLVPEHDVHITDWVNARDVPLSAGNFDFDDYTDYVMRFLRVMGPGSHAVAVCQPAVAGLAATALMAEDGDPATPRSLTLMAGPIDTRISPTRVNELAASRPISWFENNLIQSVPWRFAGAGRRVYPGMLQLTAFMSMNLDRHILAQMAQYRAIVTGDATASQAHRAFYDEYFSVMDLPADFYLQTVRRVFQDHDLPLGRLRWRDRAVRPDAIRDTALLTVEGERDDICAIGQTRAALDLCTGLRPELKRHHLQNGAGHYGVFSGRRWVGEVYPVLRDTIRTRAA